MDVKLKMMMMMMIKVKEDREQFLNGLEKIPVDRKKLMIFDFRGNRTNLHC